MAQNDFHAHQDADNVYIDVSSGETTNYYESAVRFMHGETVHWAIEKDNAASPALAFRRYNTSGVLQDTPLSIAFDGTGVTYTNPVKFTGLLSSAASASGLIMGTGTSANPATTSTADGKFIEFRCQTTAASGDNRLAYLRYDIGGAGGGECLRAFTDLTAASGTARGAHISLQADDTGYISGLGAGLDAQLYIGNAAVPAGGTYTAMNIEVYSEGASSDISAVTESSFLRFANSGNATGAGVVDDNSVLFDLNGFTSGAAKIWYDHQGAAPANIEEWVKVRTPAGVRWLALYNAVV